MWLCLSEGLVRKARAFESISFGREAKAVPPRSGTEPKVRERHPVKKLADTGGTLAALRHCPQKAAVRCQKDMQTSPARLERALATG